MGGKIWDNSKIAGLGRNYVGRSFERIMSSKNTGILAYCIL